VNRSLPEAFRAAACGLQHALRTQRNFRIQCAAAGAALLAGLLLEVPASEVALLALACGLVLAMELVNTAVEALVDGLWPQRSEVARWVKDTSAAAVVVAATVAVAVGALILAPPLLTRLGMGSGWVRPVVAAGGAGLAAAAAAWQFAHRRRAAVEDRPKAVVE